jgi:hypothetical protein
MASWFAAALPYIPDLVSLARPMFTRAKSDDKSVDLVAQINELQTVALQNTDAIKTLAVEMQRTIDALKVGSDTLTSELKSAKYICIASITVALLSFALAAYALSAHAR